MITLTRHGNVLHVGDPALCGADVSGVGPVTGDDLLCARCCALHEVRVRSLPQTGSTDGGEEGRVAPESAPVQSHECPHWRVGPRTVPWPEDECALCHPAQPDTVTL